jgi:hypothetical protein
MVMLAMEEEAVEAEVDDGENLAYTLYTAATVNTRRLVERQ